MSLATWKQKYYCLPADSSAIRSPLAAVNHSLTKWLGLREKNLKAHGLVIHKYGIAEDRNDPDDRIMEIAGCTCALCVRAKWVSKSRYAAEFCPHCPLYKTLGRRCDTLPNAVRTSEQKKAKVSEWESWECYQNPEPMIRALRRTYKRLKQQASS